MGCLMTIHLTPSVQGGVVEVQVRQLGVRIGNQIDGRLVHAPSADLAFVDQLTPIMPALLAFVVLMGLFNGFGDTGLRQQHSDDQNDCTRHDPFLSVSRREYTVSAQFM